VSCLAPQNAAMALCSSAQFRRSGQRDERRRRLLADEALGTRRAGRSSAQGSFGPRSGSAYAEDVLMNHKVSVLDLIPRRALWLGAILAGALLAAAGLVWLDLWAAKCTAATGLQLDALRLQSAQSLAGWLTSMVLGAGALAALVVYTVRRHRKDDYQGRYRVWIWAAMCWLLLAADHATALHRTVRELMVYWTSTSLMGDGSIWWLAPGGLLLAAVGSRLLIDMLPDRLATAALVAAAGCALAALSGPWETTWLGDPRFATLGPHAAAMGAAILLFWSMLAHARYVILEAQGLILRPEPRSASGGPAAGLAGSAGTLGRTDEAHASLSGDHQSGTRRGVGSMLAGALGLGRKSKGDATSESTLAVETEEESAQSTTRRKLSKAERKALRKRLIEMRLKREQSQRAAWGG